MEKLIGRKREIEVLQQCMDSDRSELVVVYGRRRIGKTFLVRQFFKDKYDFHFVGRHGMDRQHQLEEFAKELQRYSHSAYAPVLKDWIQAFDALRDYIEGIQHKGKKIIFIDELPWMDSRKSDLVMALENFWNSWASAQDDIVFVACGSATSWMVDKLLHNQGGLFGRITRQLYLRPFKLREMEDYLVSRNINWSRYQIAQCYMIFGGVPYYLTLLDPRLSLIQNVDQLFFSGDNAPMRAEYNELYSTLFSNPEPYISVIQHLTNRKEGYTRKEIAEATHIEGSTLTKLLENLERCDFIFSYQHFGNKSSNQIFRIKDFYTLFYYKYVYEQKTQDKERWTHIYNSPQVSSWQGFSFELLCILHLDEIKKALGIDRILNSSSAWRNKDEDYDKIQIDLVIERGDRIINLCEMKFSTEPYVIDKDYEMKLRNRKSIFKAVTKTKYALQTTMVTTFGVMKNKHYSVVDSEVVLDDLFDD